MIKKAKRGDIVVIERNLSYNTQRYELKQYKRYDIYIITSIDREGNVKKVKGLNGTPVNVPTGQRYIVSKQDFDGEAIFEDTRKRKEFNNFESLEEVKKYLLQFKKVN